MQLLNLLFVLSAIEATAYLSIYVPEYIRDTVRVESKNPLDGKMEVTTYDNYENHNQGAAMTCVSQDIKMTQKTCKFSPAFYRITTMRNSGDEMRLIDIRTPKYDLPKYDLAVSITSSYSHPPPANQYSAM
jgi:hypothetical protein